MMRKTGKCTASDACRYYSFEIFTHYRDYVHCLVTSQHRYLDSSRYSLKVSDFNNSWTLAAIGSVESVA